VESQPPACTDILESRPSLCAGVAEVVAENLSTKVKNTYENTRILGRFRISIDACLAIVAATLLARSL